MKIFFTASFWGKQQHQPAYDKIIKTIKSNGAEIISLETQAHKDVLGTKAIKNLTKEELHYAYIKKGINKSNAVIIEASVDSFHLGHETTLALLYSKPVLCLSNRRDYSSRIKHPKFYATQYKNLSDIDKAVTNFIRLTENKHLSVRFNAFLSPEQKNFLEWTASKTNKNISEIIRDLINNKINETQEYNEENLELYLKGIKHDLV